MNRTASVFRIVLLAGVVTAVAIPPAEAQPTIVTLESLERQALASRQSLSAQQARMRRAAAEVERRRSAYGPSILLRSDASLSPGASIERVAGVDLDPANAVLVQGIRAFGDRYAFAAQGRYGAVLDVSVNLYDFGRTALAIEAARAEQAAASADDRTTRRQVLDDVRTAYFAWLAATEVAAISEEALADARVRRTRVADLVAEGVKPAADMSPAASDEALASLEAVRARANVENARIMLDAAIGGGLPADAGPDPGDLRTAGPPVRPAAGGPESDADAAVRALERQRDAARATASMYERAHAPVVSADAQVGIRAQHPIAGGVLSGVFPTYRVGVSVSVALSDGGSANASASVARAQAEELAARSRELSQARRAERSQAEADAAAAQERLRIARELLALSERRRRDAAERYEQAGGRVEEIFEANAMRRRASTEIVLAEVAMARARFTLQDQ